MANSFLSEVALERMANRLLARYEGRYGPIKCHPVRVERILEGLAQKVSNFRDFMGSCRSFRATQLSREDHSPATWTFSARREGRLRPAPDVAPGHDV